MFSGPGPGRPKGSKNKKTLLREELEKDGSALAAALKAKALEGDPTCLGLWLARLEPAIRPRANPVEFDLDSTLSAAGQIAKVIQAVSEGALTIDEGQIICNMIRQRAEVVALEGATDGATQIVEALKQFAMNDQLAAEFAPPEETQDVVTTAPPPPEAPATAPPAPAPAAPVAPGAPRMIRKSDGTLVPSANYPKPAQPRIPPPWERPDQQT